MFNQRLIDKKMSRNSKVAKSSPPQEMCDILFWQLPSGEMKGLFPFPNFNNKKKSCTYLTVKCLGNRR